MGRGSSYIPLYGITRCKLRILALFWLLSSFLFKELLPTSRSLPIPLLLILRWVRWHTFFIKHLETLLPRCDSVWIAWGLPTRTSPFPITFAMGASQEHDFDISTPRYVYWSAIGISSSLTSISMFPVNLISVTYNYCAPLYVRCLSPLPLVYSSASSTCLCHLSCVSYVATKSSAHFNPDTSSFLTFTPCFADSTAGMTPSTCTLH